MHLNAFLPPARDARKKRSLPRRLLKMLGPTWHASPLRRAVQAVAFVLFMVLFFWVLWPYGARPNPEQVGPASHYADELAAREWIEAEAFLALDPLVSISTAIAARAWVWSLGWAAALLAVSIVFPRGFCGYLCPLGTLIDLVDWSLGKRVKRWRITGGGWWVHLRYYLLATVLVASACGVVLSGFVAAIPVLTRGLVFLIAPLQVGGFRGWHQVPPLGMGHYISIAMFLAVLGLGLLRPRFWCRYVCPTGAVFSLANGLRATHRKVEGACIECGRCAEICPFDAVRADFTTRPAACAFCQTCGGACPAGAIRFVGRWNRAEGNSATLAVAEIPLARRGFLAASLGAVAAVSGSNLVLGAGSSEAFVPVRPPGSVPEPEFLRLCVRCGECFKACPNNVLQPMGFEQGWEGLWTPYVAASWSGCEASCANCGQVCPTGAIRAIPLDEKRVARIGLAVVDKRTCLPYAGREACQLCVDECARAGYHAVEFEMVGVQVDKNGQPVENTGFLAPVVLADRCVGCGLCQTRCDEINVRAKGLLDEVAVRIVAGAGKEDRLAEGSYLELRQAERKKKEEEQRKLKKQSGAEDSYLPDFLK
ncbi:MAG: 4Fe-4S binding protein [Pirellulales bacterium]